MKNSTENNKQQPIYRSNDGKTVVYNDCMVYNGYFYDLQILTDSSAILSIMECPEGFDIDDYVNNSEKYNALLDANACEKYLVDIADSKQKAIDFYNTIYANKYLVGTNLSKRSKKLESGLNVPIKMSFTMPNENGYYDGKCIYINPLLYNYDVDGKNKYDQVTSTIVHEITHAVRKRTGFSMKERNMLNSAYKIGNRNNYEESSTLSEKSATNTELNNILYQKYIDFGGTPNPNDFKIFIQNFDRDELMHLLEFCNGYGQDYIEFFDEMRGLHREKNIGKQVGKIKEAQNNVAYSPQNHSFFERIHNEDPTKDFLDNLVTSNEPIGNNNFFQR